ncbi:hypothetical protein D3C84_886160 [compost metagenome]
MLEVAYFAGRPLGVLQRHHSQAVETLRSCGDHLGDGTVDVAAEGQGIVEAEPVGQQLRHRRQHLPLDTLGGHFLQAPVGAPGIVGHFAERLVADRHRAVMALAAVHARPTVGFLAARIDGKIGWDYMGVHINHIFLLSRRLLVDAGRRGAPVRPAPI